MLQIKCDQYWPADSEPLFYGDLQIKVLNETISRDWHIREIDISLVCARALLILTVIFFVQCIFISFYLFICRIIIIIIIITSLFNA